MSKEGNPQIPNPDQLEFISPRNIPRANPASYDPQAPAEEVLTPVPTIKIGPNAVYLVQPGYWDEKAEGVQPPDGGGTEPAQAPVLHSIEPPQLPVWAQDTEVVIHGEGFTESSIINWNGGDETTTLIDETKVSTIAKPSTVQAPLPFTLSVYVRNGEERSNELPFTFIT